MIPEINAYPNLYVSSHFPNIWEINRSTIRLGRAHSLRLIDPTIFHFNNVWWLMGMYRHQQNGIVGRVSRIHLYSSENPRAKEWRSTNGNRCFHHQVDCDGSHMQNDPHPFSVTQSHVGIRAGGRVFTYNNELYRVVQDANISTLSDVDPRLRYGSSINLYKITSLSKTGPIKQLLVPKFQHNLRKAENIGNWNRYRFHHADIQEFTDDSEKRQMYVILTDGNDYELDT